MCWYFSILTNEQNGRHPPERVVTHGSEGPAGAAARAAGVVQTHQLLLSHAGMGAGLSIIIAHSLTFLKNVYIFLSRHPREPPPHLT